MTIYLAELTSQTNESNISAVNEFHAYMQSTWIGSSPLFPPRTWSKCLSDDVEAGYMDLTNSSMESINAQLANAKIDNCNDLTSLIRVLEAVKSSYKRSEMGCNEEQRLLPAKTRITRLKQLIRYESVRRFREKIYGKDDNEIQAEMKNCLFNCLVAENSAKNMLTDKVKFNRFIEDSYKSQFFLLALNEIDTDYQRLENDQNGAYCHKLNQAPQTSNQYAQQSNQVPQQSNQYAQKSNQTPQTSNQYAQESNQNGTEDSLSQDPVGLPETTDFAAAYLDSEAARPNDFENFAHHGCPEKQIIYEFEPSSVSSPFQTLDQLEVPFELRPEESLEPECEAYVPNQPYNDRKCTENGEILIKRGHEEKIRKLKLTENSQDFRPGQYFNRHRDKYPPKKVTFLAMTQSSSVAKRSEKRLVPILPKIAAGPRVDIENLQYGMAQHYQQNQTNQFQPGAQQFQTSQNVFGVYQSESRAETLLFEKTKKNELEKAEKKKKKELEKAENRKKKELEKAEKLKKKELEKKEREKKRERERAEKEDRKRKRDYLKTKTPEWRKHLKEKEKRKEYDLYEEKDEERFMKNCEEEKHEGMCEIAKEMNALDLDYDSQWFHEKELMLFKKLRKKHRMKAWSKFLKWKPKLLEKPEEESTDEEFFIFHPALTRSVRTDKEENVARLESDDEEDDAEINEEIERAEPVKKKRVVPEQRPSSDEEED